MAHTEMQYTTLGRTGLKVSVAGLGCGGEAQLGLARGRSEDDAVALVRSAIDLGVNFFDTSEAYQTEPALGRAVRDAGRDRVVLCGKSRFRNLRTGELHPVERLVGNLDDSLRALGVDRLDIFMVHGVVAQHYDHVLADYVPALLRERDKGKFTHLGISEFPAQDPEHAAIRRALDDDVWAVVMFAFHMLHQAPARTILPRARDQGVGTAVMYAVRSIFSRPGAVREALDQAVAAGELPVEFATDDALDFLTRDGAAESLTDAAYRFARHQPGVDVVLFGTGSAAHLADNVASLLRPPLPGADVALLRERFAHLRAAGLDIPDALKKQMAPTT